VSGNHSDGLGGPSKPAVVGPASMVRIAELQAQGYVYLRP